MLRLAVLGATRLSVVGPDGEDRLLLGSGKSVALVAYLALLPSRSARRDHLIELLWSDTDPEHARRNLRQTIYQIRQRLGEDALQTRDDLVVLAAPLVVDRHQFEEAVAAGDIVAAVTRYTGPFFPAYAAPGGVAFEQWADLERRRLHHMYVGALETLIREAVEQHRHQAARVLWARLREADPDREGARRRGLEVLISAGDWMEAAAEADALEAWAAQRGHPLEPATTLLVRAARQAPASADAAEPALVAEMVGRGAEFAALVGAWEATASGGARHVHVLGAPGLGKTRLLQDVAARIAALSGRVVYVRASQGERDLDYALAADLARAVAEFPGAPGVGPGAAAVLVALDPALSARFPSARAAAPGGEILRHRVLAVADLVGSVADEAPLAVIVDDLHWADPASRQVLTGLASRVGSRPLLLITSARPQPGGIEAVTPDETLTLRALVADDVAALMESLGRVPERLQARGIYRALTAATEGSPLLVLELLRLALDRGWLVREGDQWIAHDETALLEQLHAGSAMDQRLAGLPSHERRLLLMLAAAAIPVPRAVLDAATRRIDLGSSSALAGLERAGFVAPRGDAWEPAHDLVAEKVLVTATRDELRQAHAALGHAWVSSTQGGHDMLATAARFLARAGEIDETARLFGRCEQLCRRDGDWRPPHVLAREVLGSEHQALVPVVVGRLGVVRRLRLHAPGRAIPLALAAVAALVVPVAWTSVVPRPYALAIERAPEVIDVIPQPFGVRVVDRRGRTVERFRDTVRVSIGLGGDVWRASGTVAAVPVRGIAWFDSILPVGVGLAHASAERVDSLSQTITLRAEAPGLVGVETDSVMLSGSSFLRVEAGVLNGQRLDPDSPAVRVSPGEIVVGHLNVAYRVIAGQAAIIAAGIPLWGDRRETHFPIQAMTGGRRLTRQVWAIRFRAPDRPGRHHLFIVAGTETASEFVASGTNWSLRKPVWFDGNDVVDLAPAQTDAVRRTGRITLEMLLPDMGFVQLLTPDEITVALRAGRVQRSVGRRPAAVIAVEVSDGR